MIDAALDSIVANDIKVGQPSEASGVKTALASISTWHGRDSLLSHPHPSWQSSHVCPVTVVIRGHGRAVQLRTLPLPAPPLSRLFLLSRPLLPHVARSQAVISTCFLLSASLTYYSSQALLVIYLVQ